MNVTEMNRTALIELVYSQQSSMEGMTLVIVVLFFIVVACVLWFIFGNWIKDSLCMTIRKGKYKLMKEKYEGIEPTMNRLKTEIEQTNKKNTQLRASFDKHEHEVKKLKSEIKEGIIKLNKEKEEKEKALELTKSVHKLHTKSDSILEHISAINDWFKRLPKEHSQEDNQSYYYEEGFG